MTNWPYREPWEFTGLGEQYEIRDSDGDPVLKLSCRAGEDPDDLRRAVLCVNVCNGLSDEALEKILLDGGVIYD